MSKYKAVAVRAARTFGQAFVGFLATGLSLGSQSFSVEALRGLLAGAIAAAISATLNLLVIPPESKEN